MLDESITQNINLYKQREKDEFFLKDLKSVEQAQDADELYDRFYTELEFGTGGIRGIIGAGTNRLNTLVVQRVALGLARYLTNTFKTETPKVVIAYDSRNFSKEFSQVLAQVLAAAQVKVYCYESLRATPQLSFTIRELQAHSGIVITASHNPPVYNGIKVYWGAGEQVVVPHDENIMSNIAQVKNEPHIPIMDIEEAQKAELYEVLGKELDKKFYEYIHSVLLQPNIFEVEDDFKVVYTPLHGTGGQYLTHLLEDYGISGVVEPSQSEPDGSFPTVALPNPEEQVALTNAINTAKSIGAQLVIANDPDADRVGMAQLTDDEFICLTGNQIGVLLLDYIITTKQSQGNMHDNYFFVNTIVTSLLQEKIAHKHGVHTVKTYTGFKNIASEIALFEKERKYLFSCEESYGYLASDQVRDKDGISIAMLCIEMAKHYYAHNHTLFDRLQDIYTEYGYHQEQTINKVLTGAAGKEKINSIMKQLRNSPPHMIGDEQVVQIDDYMDLTSKSIDGTTIGALAMRQNANVLIFTTNTGNQICMRPSGTEPKIKFYFLFQSTPQEGESFTSAQIAVQKQIEVATRALEEWIV